MIVKSDVIILALSTTFLVAGIIRWQHNTSVVPVVTIPASSQGTGVTLASAQDADFAPIVTRLPTRDEPPSTAIPDANRSATIPTSATPEAPTTGLELEDEPDARVATATTSETSSPVSDPSPQLLGTYTVVSGDYLGWIAEEFGTTVAELKELNNLQSNDIRIGQKIKYPLPN